MWFSPVRICRDTTKIEMSKLHWSEMAQYSYLFAAEKDFLTANNKNDIRSFLDRAICKYELDTFKLRKKAFEKESEGKIFLIRLEFIPHVIFRRNSLRCDAKRE